MSITREKLNPALQNLIKSGISESDAHREIGFALDLINSSEGDTKNGDMTRASQALLNTAVSMVGYYGLTLSPANSECTLVAKMKGKKIGCYFMPLYGGLLKVDVKSGAIIGANCHVVHEKDDIQINAGRKTDKVQHNVKSFGKEKAVVTYCVLYLPSGIEQLSLLREHEYQLIAKMGVSFIHNKWGDQMRMKSAYKRARKMVAGGEHGLYYQLAKEDDKHYDFEAIEKEETPKQVPVKKEERNPENPSNLPVLNKDHKKWNGAVQALINKSQTIETLRNHVYISNEIEDELLMEAKITIPEPKKQAS